MELVAKELVSPVRGSSMEGETEFLFVHALVCDVAYGQLTRADRAAKHAALARWLEERTAGRTEDLAEILAYHYGTALEMATSCGLFELEDELSEPTARYLALAGGRAAPLDAAAAAQHFARAERVADDAAKPKRRFFLSRRTRRTLRRRAPLLVGAAAVIAVAAVAALAIWAFAPSKTSSDAPKTMTAAQIAAKYGSSVVRITTHPLPASVILKKKPRPIVGSGFMASKDGVIVTSTAVVQGQGMSAPMTVNVEYALPTGEYGKATGRVLAHNEESGVALIKVDPRKVPLKPLPLGDSDSIATGEWIVGLGAQREMSLQQATGVVTELRTLKDAISGNDHVLELVNNLEYPVGPSSQPLAGVGGPLFDRTGHVVALVGPAGVGSGSVWSYSGDISRQAVGIWWAIAQITYAGSHPGFKRGAAYMGVQYSWLTRKEARQASKNMWGLSPHAGALVEEVGIGSPADEAGIRPGDSPVSFDGKVYLLGGDTIVSVDGVGLIRDGQMATIVTRHKPGDVIPVRLWRHGRLMTVEVKLAAMP